VGLDGRFHVGAESRREFLADLGRVGDIRLVAAKYDHEQQGRRVADVLERAGDAERHIDHVVGFQHRSVLTVVAPAHLELSGQAEENLVGAHVGMQHRAVAGRALGDGNRQAGRAQRGGELMRACGIGGRQQRIERLRGQHLVGCDGNS
jgi:hypothetical protein